MKFRVERATFGTCQKRLARRKRFSKAARVLEASHSQPIDFATQGAVRKTLTVFFEPGQGTCRIVQALERQSRGFVGRNLTLHPRLSAASAETGDRALRPVGCE